VDERHALRSGEVNLMDAQWTSPEAPAHEFARQDARQWELTPVNLVLAKCETAPDAARAPALLSAAVCGQPTEGRAEWLG
jgi:hypothetical protein